MIEAKGSSYLIIINDGPYGNERPYNALRLAMKLVKTEATRVRVFLMADGVQCAVRGQETPQGYYNIERMLTAVLRGGEVATCGTCQKARGLGQELLIENIEIGSMELLTDWTLEADKVLVF
jgi:uncharacterized protein involved in oxidation of intracellular sulfur